MTLEHPAFNLNSLDAKPAGKVVEVCFNTPDASVNVFNQAIFEQLNQVLAQLEQEPGVIGAIFTSGKSLFVAGAEIPALLDMGKAGDVTGIHRHVRYAHAVFDRLAALPFPTVAVINGVALGGGLEFALAADARVMANTARIGLPEVNLGLFPGYAGTVRLPRMIDPLLAIDWISSGKPRSAKEALEQGLIMQAVDSADLQQAAIDCVLQLRDACAEIRADKAGSIKLTKSVDAELRARAAHRANQHYPAAQLATALIVEQRDNDATTASIAEAKAFAEILTSATAVNLLSVFVNEQAVAKAAKQYAKSGGEVAHAAVIGAGIMGGGIAYQAASKEVEVVLRDVNGTALAAGVTEAKRNFSVLVKKGKISQEVADQRAALIHPTLEADTLRSTQLVVEAVVENASVKQQVLASLENETNKSAVLTSNTSTISIDRLAQGLARPDQFCGMHFFNPVPLMPLVEIVRGDKTSQETIATTVKFALALGKNPIVVNDSPGFLVNRVLFPYIIAAQMLIAEGVDYQQIDQVMQSWGWPMGPAHLSDVIGLDTMVHCLDVMADDIPERMAPQYISAIHTLHKNERLGQKNGAGFYQYAQNEQGRPVKIADDTAQALIYINRPSQIDETEIQERLTVALCLETVRCLEEGVVASAAEADMALVWGLGYPRFRGGALRHIDTLGIDAFCAMASRYENKGPLYKITDGLESMRKSGRTFY